MIYFVFCVGVVNKGMNILIIGNGFDLAHGLKTTYRDFLEFANNYISEEYPLIKLKWTRIENNGHSWIDEIEGKISFIKSTIDLHNQNNAKFKEIEYLVNGNVWIDYFNKKNIDQGWIDFENEISNVVKRFDRIRKNFIQDEENDGNDYQLSDSQKMLIADILSVHKEHLTFDLMHCGFEIFDRLKDILLFDLNRLTRCLEIYLSEFLEGKPEPLSIIDKLDIQKVLSFNYTDTYRRLYDKNESESSIKYDYIHGKAKPESTIDECNMIIGIEEYLNDYEMDKDNAFIEFKKFYQRIYKRTGCDYVSWLQAIKVSASGQHEAYIFGHYLDPTDGDVLRDIIMNTKIKTKIFYHNKEALGKQITNLVKVIGEKNLISYVHGREPKIELIEISESIK